MVSMDCFPSLKTVAVREMEQDWGKPLCYAAYWLLDAGVDWRAGFSTFDVAPVDDALKLIIRSWWFVRTNIFLHAGRLPEHLRFPEK